MNLTNQFVCSSLLALCAIAPVATAQEQATPPRNKPPRNQVAESTGKTAPSLDDFYRGEEVQSVHLQVAKEDLQRMLDALPKRIYVQASFRWRNIAIQNVAIRYKGNSSSRRNQRHKRSFLIKFNEYDRDGRFLGLQRVSLDNGVQFGSLFSEPIITEILRDEKITTHRCNYAKLYLNDSYQGVYVNVERIDESFIERRLPDPRGLLFKVDLGGPGANLSFLGDDPTAYKRAFEPKSKSAEKQADQLVQFIKMVNQPANDFASKLDSKMELDDFLRVTAVLLFSGAFDQLTGWNHHNYYLYHDSLKDRWRYLPWDLDVGFSEVAFGRIHVLADWHAAWPVAGPTPNPLLERIIADPVLLSRYRRVARLILDKYFDPERLCAKFDAKYELIKPHLRDDPFPHQRVTNPSDRDYDDVVASMKVFVRKRYATARQQLETPGQRPKIARRPPPRGAQPRPGVASKDAPTQLKVVSSNQSTVVLRWKDNADGEVAHIVQRAAGVGDSEFRNHMLVMGDKSTEATDRGVQSGRTYRYRVYAVHRAPGGPKGTGVSNEVTIRVNKRDSGN